MRLRTTVILNLIVLILAVNSALAQTRPIARLEGRIRLSGASPSAGYVRVQLQRLGSTIQEQRIADGRFTFEEVAPGPYTVEASAPGYLPAFRYVEFPMQLDVVIDLYAANKAGQGEAAASSIFDLQVPKAARKQFDIAAKKARAHDCAGAVAYLNGALRIFERYADAHNQMGLCYMELNQLAKAEQSYREAAALTPSIYPALNLAELYVKQLKLSEAEEVLTSAIGRNPFEGDGYFGLANVHFEQKRFAEAAKAGLEAHGHPRHSPDVHLLLAKIYSGEEKPDPMISQLELYVREAEPGPQRKLIEQILALK